MNRCRVQAAHGEIATEHSEHLDVRNLLADEVSELCGLIVVLLDHEAAHPRTPRPTRHVDGVERTGCLSAVRTEAVWIEMAVNVDGIAHQRARSRTRPWEAFGGARRRGGLRERRRARRQRHARTHPDEPAPGD